MKVLTIYANPNPKSFCHAVLEQFTKGLADAGHSCEIIDLYAIHFNPVLTSRDYPCWISKDIPMASLKSMILDNRGWVPRPLVELWLRNKNADDLARLVRRFRPKDVVEQQQKMAEADGLAIISPVWFVGFPAILKGWIERVFTYGFAYNLSPEGWKGDIKGRIPLLKQKKALLISTTLFDQAAYQDGLGEAMRKLIDDFGFRFPGIKDVKHVYFYSVSAVSPDVRQGYLQEAHRLGKEY